MICKECNAKNTKNDKFCRNCGKKLNVDEVANSNNSFEDFIKKSWGDIKGIFLKPVDTAKEFIKDENYISSLIYLGVNVLLVGIFVLMIIKSLFGAVTGMMGINGLGYGNIGYGALDSIYDNISIPYFKIFLVAILTVVIVYGVLTGVSYLVCKYLFKSDTSFKKMLTWVGINSLFNSVASVAVLFGMLISYKLGVVLYLIGTLVYEFNMIRTFEYTTNTDKNKLGYALTLAIIATLLVTCVILPKIFF